MISIHTMTLINSMIGAFAAGLALGYGAGQIITIALV